MGNTGFVRVQMNLSIYHFSKSASLPSRVCLTVISTDFAIDISGSPYAAGNSKVFECP